MLRKQRKLQLWRRFGYVILIIIKFGELLLWFSPRIINGLRSYIKHSKGCFIRYPNTLKLVRKKTRLRLVFSTISRCLDIFLMFDILHEMININKEERRNFLSTYFAENPNLGKPEIRYVIFWLEVTNIDQMGKKTDRKNSTLRKTFEDWLPGRISNNDEERRLAETNFTLICSEMFPRSFFKV